MAFWSNSKKFLEFYQNGILEAFFGVDFLSEIFSTEKSRVRKLLPKWHFGRIRKNFSNSTKMAFWKPFSESIFCLKFFPQKKVEFENCYQNGILVEFEKISRILPKWHFGSLFRSRFFV